MSFLLNLLQLFVCDVNVSIECRHGIYGNVLRNSKVIPGGGGRGGEGGGLSPPAFEATKMALPLEG